MCGRNPIPLPLHFIWHRAVRLQVQGLGLISDASAVSGQVLSASDGQWWPVVDSPRAKLFPIVASSNFSRDPLDLSNFNLRNMTLRPVYGVAIRDSGELLDVVLHGRATHLHLRQRSQFFGLDLLAISILHPTTGPRSARKRSKVPVHAPHIQMQDPSSLLLGAATLGTSTTADY